MKHNNQCQVCNNKSGLKLYWGWCEECWEKSLDDIDYGLSKEDNHLTDNE